MPFIARSLFAASFAAVLFVDAHAQAPARPSSPEDNAKAMTSAMDAMVPVMTRMTEQAIEVQLKVAERPETAARLAAFKRNLYEALLKKGFTGDQAMQITIATPLPTATQTK